MATVRLGLDTLTENQAAAEVTFNQAMYRIDALASLGVKDWATAPPASPAEGDVYLVKATATGDWAGHENKVTHYHNSQWRFTTPALGMIAYVQKIAGVDANTLYFWKDTTLDGNGDTWTLGPILQEDADTADKDAISGHIIFPEDKTYTLEQKAVEAYTINSLTTKLSAGTCSVQLQIDAVNCGASNSATTSEASTAIGSANAVAAGDTVTMIVSSSSSTVADLTFTVEMTKDLSAGDD